MLDIIDVHKTFFKGEVNEKKALSGVSFKLEHGDFVTVIGGNGAGKSTLLNCVAGVHIPESGKIILEDQDITNTPEYLRAGRIARVFQDPLRGTAASMTLEENLVMALKRGQKRGFRKAIKEKERQLFRERLAVLNLGLENRLKDKVGLLSGGQRQALTLLMATLQKPKLLLLDEHTAALDPQTANKVMELTQWLVKEFKLTTLMVTHNMEQALKYGNRIIMMDDGSIILDLRDDKKEKLTVGKLMEHFAKTGKGSLNNDRMLLSKWANAC
ncbi:MAG: ABC transporter ATP-binding protein [Clostridia bacterium]|nr:ABC transporter ATP-binding protein [Clostridia bacterium]